MVMSQAAIGALMAQKTDGADAEAENQLEASDAELDALTAGESLAGALSAEEIAIVQAAAMVRELNHRYRPAQGAGPGPRRQGWAA